MVRFDVDADPRQTHKSGFIGVSQSNLKWRARIRQEGRNRTIGTFATKEDAAKAYDDAARKQHGGKATLNYDSEGKLNFG